MVNTFATDRDPAYTPDPDCARDLCVAELADLREWAACRADEALAALDAEATPEQVDDDGRLFHGRLPSDDRDAFNPCVVALAEVA